MSQAIQARSKAEELEKAKAAANDKHAKNVKSIETKRLIAIEIERRGWNKMGAAERLGVSRGTLYNALDGKISGNMASALAKVFGRTSDFWRRDTVFASPDELKITSTTSLVPSTKVTANEVVYGSRSAILTDFMIEQAVRNNEIEIHPYNSKNKRSLSYDMTVGAIVFQHKDELTETVSEHIYDWPTEGFNIEPGQSVKITTQEAITLPLNYYARPGAIAEHVRKYLHYSIGLQVDPGFSGHLVFGITNMGMTPFWIWRDQRILSIELNRLLNAPEQGVAYYSSLEKVDDFNIFDEVSQKFDEAVWTHFTSFSGGGGKVSAKLPDNSIELTAEDPEELRGLCLEEFKTKAVASEPAVKRFVDLTLGVLELNIEEIEALLDEWDIKYDPETGNYKTPAGETGQILLPGEGKALNLHVFAAFLRTPTDRFSDAFLGKISWTSVLTT